jgi:predicted PurR-regulated permease PerM
VSTQQSILLTLIGAACVGLIVALQPILMPFLVGALLAYLGDPWADRLEHSGLSRTWAVILCFSAISVVVLIILLLFIPALVHQVHSLVIHLPETLLKIQTQWLPSVMQTLGLELDFLEVDHLKQWLIDHWGQSKEVFTSALKQVGASSAAIMSLLANLALIPVVTFYLLRDWDVLVEKIHHLFPRKMAPRVDLLARECDEVLGAFLKGQLLVMLCLGALYALGLSLLGLQYGLLIGVIAGLASIVPYLGFIVGISIASIAAILQFQLGWELAMVVIVFGIGQAIEGVVLTPWLVGDKIGLHPVAVIFAILAGGQLFGMVGILLALPVGAVIMVLLRHVHDNYKVSEFYGAQDSQQCTEGVPSERIELEQPNSDLDK